MKTQINWTKVGDRTPDDSGHFYHGSPCSPYVSCLVFACYSGKPQGGVVEIIRWDAKNNQWHAPDISAQWTLQPPYQITHFCDDKLNYPDDTDFMNDYETGGQNDYSRRGRMKKIFYNHGRWWAFVPPEKPIGENFFWNSDHRIAFRAYEKAYAEAKANALEVGNYGEIYTIVNDNLDREITLPCTEIDGVEYFDWKGSAVIKDGKYILSI